STPAVKGFDSVIDSGQFEFPDDVALPGEFDFSWTVPADAPPGALICNYAKDTGGSAAGGKENRKGGAACFSVPAPPPTTTTSTETVHGAVAATTTTPIPPAVLGESFTKSPLAFTGADSARLVAIAGVLMVTGGLLLLVRARREEGQALTRR